MERAASSSPRLTLSVSTTLMQDYRQAAPLGDAKDLALAWTPEGELEVFAIGLDKNLYVLRRDPASPTGWREGRVEFPPTVTSVTSLATLDVANEHDRMFVLANGYWYEMARDDAGNDQPRFITVFPGALRLGASDCGDDVALVAAPYVPGQKLMPCSGILTRGIAFLLLDGQGGLSAEKIRCLSDRSSVWPHLPFVVLQNGSLRALRGVTETPPGGDDQVDQVDQVDQEIAFEGGLAAAGFRTSKLRVEDVALPQLPHVTDFAVVRGGEGWILLATDGSATLSVLSGAVDPQVPGGIRWAAAWRSLELTGQARPSFAHIDALRLPDKRIEVMLRDAGGSLWITGWNGPEGDVWNAATPLGFGGSTFTANLNDAAEMVFACSSQTAGIRTSWRDASLDWHPEAVAVPSEADLETANTYRVSITVVDEWNAGVAQLPMRISATDDVALSIGSTRQWIGPRRSVTLSTNATGTLDLTLDVSNTLYAPTLVIEGDFLAADGAGRLELRPDRDAQHHLANLTGNDLLAATDASSGQPLLPPAHRNLDDATQIALALGRVCRELDPTYSPQAAPSDAVSGRVTLAGTPRGVRWGRGGEARKIVRRSAESAPWSLDLQDGRLRFRDVSAAEFDALATRANDFLGIDWGSVLEAIKDGLAKVVGVASDAARAVVRFVLNGVERVVSIVLETIEEVFDLVTSIFDAAGIPLGAVVGWLLGAIGFLFDWKKVGAIRDRLRNEFFHNVAQVPAILQDPASLSGVYRGALEDMRQHIREWIQALERSPLGNRSFSSVIGPVPALPNYFVSGGSSIFNPASWLLEKAMDGLGRLTADYGLPAVDGLQQAVDAWIARARDAAGQLADLSQGFWAGDPSAWAANLASFQSGNMVNLARALADRVVAVVDLLEGVLDDLVKILHLAWANATAWAQWLDREIEIPFISTFYRRILGGHVSLVDLGCLCVAVAIAAAGGASGGEVMTSASISKDAKWWAVFTSAFHVVAEGANIASASWARCLRLFADFMLVAFGLFAIMRTDPGWRPVGAYVLGMCVFDVVVRARGISPWISGGCGLACYAAAIRWVSVDSLPLPLDARVVGALIIVSFAFSHLASTLPAAQRTPQIIAGYTILQSAISGSATAVWIATGSREQMAG